MKRIMGAGVLGLFLSTAVLPVAAQQDSGTLEKIKSSGEIVLGYRETAVPFSFLDSQHQPAGFALDLCMEIVDQIKGKLGMQDLKIEYQPVTASNRIPLLGNGSIDLECGSTTNTAERRKVVDFLFTTYVTGTKVIARVDSGFKSLEDMKGKKIAVTIGTNNIKAVQRTSNDDKLNFELVYGKDHAENFLLLKNGRVDGFSTDDILLSSLRAESGDPDAYAFVGSFLSTEPYAIMIRKSDPEFKQFADQVLTDTFKSGKFSEIYDKWFTRPIPPNNVNLNVPMSDELRELMKNPNDIGA
ncbi:MAG: amino acid ABC transporter substrate-binding protein [Burkholderiaceae bacterium]|nr:amino acid ABC transporter substrate-binding protein [Burkholderiaceae bacterium]